MFSHRRNDKAFCVQKIKARRRNDVYARLINMPNTTIISIFFGTFLMLLINIRFTYCGASLSLRFVNTHLKLNEKPTLSTGLAHKEDAWSHCPYKSKSLHKTMKINPHEQFLLNQRKAINDRTALTITSAKKNFSRPKRILNSYKRQRHQNRNEWWKKLRKKCCKHFQ